MLLVKFEYEILHTGYLDSIFLCSQQDYDRLIGKYVYFGDVLGKHSSVGVTIRKEHLTILSQDQDKLPWLMKVFQHTTLSGHNPLEYLDDYDDYEVEEE